MNRPEREVICPYCRRPAQRAYGADVYPARADLRNKRFWLCTPCDARVGVHENSRAWAPLGRLANAELRRAKMDAHAAFDPLWKGGPMKRTAAYAELANALGISVQRCHIGMFDLDTCRRVAEWARALRGAL